MSELKRTQLYEAHLAAGGQMAVTDTLHNYPGFEDGIDGFTLGLKMQMGAEKYGALTEYADAKKNSLPAGLGDVYVIKGAEGIYIAANIKDTEIFTDGENWHRGDMGQKGNNDDFIIYITDSDASERKTICLSAANLLRVYDSGVSLDSPDVTLEFKNLVYNNKLSDYKYHVATKGLANCGESEGLTLELYISYDDLGIEAPDNIKLCFNYNNVSSDPGGRTSEDNYLVKADGNEENTDAYFSIDELIK